MLGRIRLAVNKLRSVDQAINNQVKKTSLNRVINKLLNALNNVDDGSTPQLVFFQLDREYEFLGQKFTRCFLVTRHPFETIHFPTTGEVEFEGWQLKHPHTYYLPVYFIDFIHADGEAMPLFVSLKENWNHTSDFKETLQDLLNTKLLAENMSLKLKVQTLEQYIPILVEEPTEAKEKLGKVLQRLAEDLGGVYRVALEYGKKPIYKSRDFWFFMLIGVGILIIIILKLMGVTPHV